MDFAVVKINGKQYLVTPGAKVQITGTMKLDSRLEVSDVLLLNLSDNLQVGAPLIPNLTLRARVLANSQGEKIRVAKFKAKSRYRRVMGFRPQLTTIQFEDFSTTVSSIKPITQTKKPSLRKNN